MAELPLTGSFQILFLYDVCEEIHLEQLRGLIAARRTGEDPNRRPEQAIRQPSPEYVRFERPPVVQPLGPMTFKSGGRFHAEVNYYEYGAVSVKFGFPFELDWPELVALSSKWIADSELEAEALKIARQCVSQVGPALVRPSQDWPTGRLLHHSPA